MRNIFGAVPTHLSVALLTIGSFQVKEYVGSVSVRTLVETSDQDYAAASKSLAIDLTQLISAECPINCALSVDWTTNELKLDYMALHFPESQCEWYRDLLAVLFGASCPLPWDWCKNGHLCWDKICQYWNMPTLNYLLHISPNGHPTLINSIQVPLDDLHRVTWNAECGFLLLESADESKGQWRWHIPFSNPVRDARVLLAHFHLGLWNGRDRWSRVDVNVLENKKDHHYFSFERSYSDIYAQRLASLCHDALVLIEGDTIFVLPQCHEPIQEGDAKYLFAPLPKMKMSIIMATFSLSSVNLNRLNEKTCRLKQVGSHRLLKINDRGSYLLDRLHDDWHYEVIRNMISELLLKIEQEPSFDSIESDRIVNLQLPWLPGIRLPRLDLTLAGQISVNRAIARAVPQWAQAKIRFDLDLEWHWWLARYAATIKENKVSEAFDMLPNCHGMTHWANGSPPLFLFATDDGETVKLCAPENGHQSEVPLPNDPTLKETVLKIFRRYLRHECQYANVNLCSSLPYQPSNVTVQTNRIHYVFSPSFTKDVRDRLVHFVVGHQILQLMEL